MIPQLSILFLLFINTKSHVDYVDNDDNYVLPASPQRISVGLPISYVRLEDTDGHFIDDDDVPRRIPTYDSDYQTIYTYPDVNPRDIFGFQNGGINFELENGFLTYKTKRRPVSRKKEGSVDNIKNVRFVSRFQSKYFPYSNIVRLSTGCTGTLLTPYHVITAAHCVHNGNRYKRNIDMLKIEVPELIGSRLFYVMELNVPIMWRKTQSFPEVARGAYDYAILKLNLPVRGRDQFMHLSEPDVTTLNSDLTFVTFSSSRNTRLIQSICNPDDNLLVMNGNVLLSSCEAVSKGSSGSAIFVDSGKNNKRFVGVLSNTIKTVTGNKEFEAIMLLTDRKCSDICTMIYPEGNLYNVCDTPPLTLSNKEDRGYKTLKSFG